MNTAITLDVTHLIVAAVALMGPIVLKRLQSTATPTPPTSPPTPPPPAPTLPPDVAAMLPLHGALVNLVLKLMDQQTPQPTK